MQLPRWLARFNRVGTNRVMGLWAPYLPPFGVVEHRGRKSGARYRTVVLAFRRRNVVTIVLTYGETDWLRNVLAADGGQITRLGRTQPMTNPRVLRSGQAHRLPAGTRWTLRVFDGALIADLPAD